MRDRQLPGKGRVSLFCAGWLLSLAAGEGSKVDGSLQGPPHTGLAQRTLLFPALGPVSSTYRGERLSPAGPLYLPCTEHLWSSEGSEPPSGPGGVVTGTCPSQHAALLPVIWARSAVPWLSPSLHAAFGWRREEWGWMDCPQELCVLEVAAHP